MRTAVETRVPSKVMHICLSRSWGGLEMYPGRVASEFQRQGWEVHGVALADSHVADSLKAVGVTPLVFGSPIAALLAARTILRYLRREGIQVVHCHKSGDMRLGALLVALAPDLRLFFTEHMGARKPKKDWYHRWAYGKVQKVFAISESTRAGNLEALPLPAQRIRRLYPGVDFAPFDTPLPQADRRRLRTSLGAPPGGLLIALPGRITPEKGHGLLLEALALLRERALATPWACVMIGAPTENDARAERFARQLKERASALGLAEQVTFAGFRRDLPACLQAVDVVCIPSRNEPFGLAVIEALAAGNPVIGSASGAIPELVAPQWGCTADPDDPRQWADALQWVLTSAEQRQALGKAGSAWVRQTFAMDVHVQALIAAYRGEDQPVRQSASA